MLPNFPVPDGYDAEGYFRHVAREGLERRFHDFEAAGKTVDREAVLARAHKRHHPPAHIPSSPAQIELCGCRINLV